MQQRSMFWNVRSRQMNAKKDTEHIQSILDLARQQIVAHEAKTAGRLDGVDVFCSQLLVAQLRGALVQTTRLGRQRNTS